MAARLPRAFAEMDRRLRCGNRPIPPRHTERARRDARNRHRCACRVRRRARLRVDAGADAPHWRGGAQHDTHGVDAAAGRGAGWQKTGDRRPGWDWRGGRAQGAGLGPLDDRHQALPRQLLRLSDRRPGARRTARGLRLGRHPAAVSAGAARATSIARRNRTATPGRWLGRERGTRQPDRRGCAGRGAEL